MYVLLCVANIFLRGDASKWINRTSIYIVGMVEFLTNFFYFILYLYLLVAHICIIPPCGLPIRFPFGLGPTMIFFPPVMNRVAIGE
jgi:hypothetical protein